MRVNNDHSIQQEVLFPSFSVLLQLFSQGRGVASIVPTLNNFNTKTLMSFTDGQQVSAMITTSQHHPDGKSACICVLHCPTDVHVAHVGLVRTHQRWLSCLNVCIGGGVPDGRAAQKR